LIQYANEVQRQAIGKFYSPNTKNCKIIIMWFKNLVLIKYMNRALGLIWVVRTQQFG